MSERSKPHTLNYSAGQDCNWCKNTGVIKTARYGIDGSTTTIKERCDCQANHKSTFNRQNTKLSDTQ